MRKTAAVAESRPEPADKPLASINQKHLIPGPELRHLATKKHLYWIVPAAAVCISAAVYLFHFAGIPQQAEVKGRDSEGADDAASAYRKASEAKNSIAVLPFVNMSDSPENDYVCEGISEELIGLLAKVPPLKVVARTSSFMFKDKGTDVRQIAELLDVNNVL